MLLIIFIIINIIVGKILHRVIIRFSKILLKDDSQLCEIYLPSYLTPLITVLFSTITFVYFGLTLTMLAALGFSWILIILAILDWKTHLLPDYFTLPGLWLGLGVNLHDTFTDLHSAVIGAIVGYCFLWWVFWLYKFITGKEGMGYGDFKLLAMLGAFLGWQAIPAIVFIASLSGTLIAAFFLLNKRISFTDCLPFGPFLAIAGWISLIGSDKIHLFYPILRI